MKKTILAALLFAAISASAQTLTITPAGKKFIITSTVTRDNGRKMIEESPRPIDTVQAKKEIADFIGGINQRMAELNLELSRLSAEKAIAENSFFSIDGKTTAEDDATVKMASFFTGKYLFTRAGVTDTLLIDRKAAFKANDRLVTKLSSATGKGTLKIESQGAALVISLFRDSKNKLLDARLVSVGSDLFVAEIEGEKVFFQKLPPEKEAKKPQ